MPKRDLHFYTELVLATVFSFIAGHSWQRWVSESLDYLYPGSLKVDFIVALVSTAVAILALHFIFSDKNDEKFCSDREKECNSLEKYFYPV